MNEQDNIEVTNQEILDFVEEMKKIVLTSPSGPAPALFKSKCCNELLIPSYKFKWYVGCDVCERKNHSKWAIRENEAFENGEELSETECSQKRIDKIIFEKKLLPTIKCHGCGSVDEDVQMEVKQEAFLIGICRHCKAENIISLRPICSEREGEPLREVFLPSRENRK